MISSTQNLVDDEIASLLQPPNPLAGNALPFIFPPRIPSNLLPPPKQPPAREASPWLPTQQHQKTHSIPISYILESQQALQTLHALMIVAPRNPSLCLLHAPPQDVFPPSIATPEAPEGPRSGTRPPQGQIHSISGAAAGSVGRGHWRPHR